MNHLFEKESSFTSFFSPQYSHVFVVLQSIVPTPTLMRNYYVNGLVTCGQIGRMPDKMLNNVGCIWLDHLRLFFQDVRAI